MIKTLLLVLLAAVLSLLLLAACTSPRWDGEPSAHFDGTRFVYPEPFPHRFTDVFWYMLTAERESWEEDPAPPAGARPPVVVDDGRRLYATFVNHATVLLQVDGLNLLTDPIWSDVAGPFRWAGARRYREPGLRFEKLPPIDVVMISHNHYDHFDLPTLERLRDVHDPLFVVPAGDGAILERRGFERYVELQWWESVVLDSGCRLHATPVRHWSGRWGFDRNLSLWAGFVLETSGGPVYFAGDAGYDEAQRETRERFGPMRLSLLPIGAYLPRDFMKYQHMNPEDAVRAHRDLGSAFSLGVHWGTFRLAAEGRDQPLEDLAAARERLDVDKENFVAARFGETYDVPANGAAGCGIP